jgi:hypothetical protein
MENDGNRPGTMDSVAAEADSEQQVAPGTSVPLSQESTPKVKEKTIFAEIYDAKKVHDVIPRIKEKLTS